MLIDIARNPQVAIVPLTTSTPKTMLHIRFSTAQTGLDQESTDLADHAHFLDRTRLSQAPLALLNRHLARVFAL